MKPLKLIPATAIMLTLAACSSTQTTPPTLELKTNQEYVWNDDISYALNIARMAQPAGIGLGLQDEANYKDATTNKTNVGVGTALSTLTNGLVGGGMGFFMDSATNARRDWNPTLIDLVPAEEIGNLSSPGAFKKIQNYVYDNVRKSLDAKFKGIEWLGPLTASYRNPSSNTILALKGSVCQQVVNFGKYSEGNLSVNTFDISKRIFENIASHKFTSGWCSLDIDLHISGTVSHEGRLNYVVVSELNSGYFFLDTLNNGYKGNILNPDVYSFRTSDKDIEIRYIGNKYPFVSKKGIAYVFSK